MKAALIRKYGEFEIAELPIPEPGPYQALCKVIYASTCTGTDTHILDGVFPWSSPLPTVPGHESAGRVVKLGERVRNFKIGDLISRVAMPPVPELGISVCWGGYAEFGLAGDSEAMESDGLPEKLWKPCRLNKVISEKIAPETAPMFTTWRENLSYIMRLGIKEGVSVLISGSGGNGLSMARCAVNLGARVTLVGSTHIAGRAKLETGCSNYFDYKSEDLAVRLKSEMNSGAFDIIIDAVGKADTAAKLIPFIKRGGVYSTYGIDDYGQLSVEPSKYGADFKVIPCTYDEAETHEIVTEWVLRGKLTPDLWYDPAKPYAFTDINKAFADLRARKSVKALLKFE